MPARIMLLAAFALWLLIPVPGGYEGAVVDRVRKVPAVEIEIRALAEREPQPRDLILKADRPARLRFSSDWEGVGKVRVELTGRADALGSAGARRVRLEAILGLPDGRRIQATRETVVQDRSTFLFELYRQGERPFTLAVTAEISQSWEVTKTVSVGPPVRFEVEVLLVDGSSQISLERNMLHTFENQTIRYEFKRGPELTDEALTLSLTPVRLVGDIVEIKVNIEGRLPGAEGVTVIARDDNLVVNRGAISPIEATTGDPPVGYRFRVKALF